MNKVILQKLSSLNGSQELKVDLSTIDENKKLVEVEVDKALSILTSIKNDIKALQSKAKSIKLNNAPITL